MAKAKEAEKVAAESVEASVSNDFEPEDPSFSNKWDVYQKDPSLSCRWCRWFQPQGPGQWGQGACRNYAVQSAQTINLGGYIGYYGPELAEKASVQIPNGNIALFSMHDISVKETQIKQPTKYWCKHWARAVPYEEGTVT